MFDKKPNRLQISQMIKEINKKENVTRQIKSILSEEEKEDILDLKNIDDFSNRYQFPIKLKLLSDNIKLFNTEEVNDLRNYIFEEKKLTAHTKKMLFDMLSGQYDIQEVNKAFMNDLILNFKIDNNDLELSDSLKQKILKLFILDLNASLINAKEYKYAITNIENDYQIQRVKSLVL